MANCFIKELHLNDGISTLAVNGSMPNDGPSTLAIVTRIGGAVAIAARAAGSDETLSVSCGADVLPTSGEVGVTVHGAGADAVFAVMGDGDVSESALLADITDSLDNPCAGSVPAGTTIKVTSGARTVRAEGDFHWNSMPPDEVFGHGIVHTGSGLGRVVFTRVAKSLPSGTATTVTLSRGTASTTDVPEWSQSSGSAYCVAKLKCNALASESGDIDLEWVRLTITHYGSVGVTNFNGGGGGTTVNYGSPLNLSSTANWSGTTLTVTDPA